MVYIVPYLIRGKKCGEWRTLSPSSVTKMFLDLVQMWSKNTTFFYSIFPQQVSLETVNPTLTELSGKSSILCLEKLRLRGSPHFKVYTKNKWLKQEHLEILFLACFYLSKKKCEKQRRRKKALTEFMDMPRSTPCSISSKAFFSYSTDGFHESWSKLRDWRVFVGTVSYFECAFWKLKLLEQNL